MDFLPKDFSEYLELKGNRADFIQSWLLKQRVSSDKIVIGGKSHVLVQFAPAAYNPQYRIKTVIAHHDRAGEGPGANDNSAACFQLMQWAVSLSKYIGFHNVRIIFTDGEESGEKSGVADQGAYSIASAFRRIGLSNDDVYVFDACGRGNIPVLAKTAFPSVSPKLNRQFYNLFSRTQDILRKTCPGRWMSLPVPYSDNASFLAQGIPAVAVTMLPAQEASVYAQTLFAKPELERLVMNSPGNAGLEDYLPYTWRLFHTQNDCKESLTSESFAVMEKILRTLADSKTYA